MKKEVSIWIGEYYASAEKAVISTLLGSCIAVCLFDPVAKIGGMNHILLAGEADLRQYNAPARYAVNAMELLINRILNLGGDRSRLIAKVFGGAHLLPATPVSRSPGKYNAEFVVKFLNTDGIRITSMDLGGRHPRKILFHTDTGEVYLKRIKSALLRKIAASQDEELDKVREKSTMAGEVILFKD